jgi:hypothetical protein
MCFVANVLHNEGFDNLENNRDPGVMAGCVHGIGEGQLSWGYVVERRQEEVNWTWMVVSDRMKIDTKYFYRRTGKAMCCLHFEWCLNDQRPRANYPNMSALSSLNRFRRYRRCGLTRIYRGAVALLHRFKLSCIVRCVNAQKVGEEHKSCAASTGGSDVPRARDCMPLQTRQDCLSRCMWIGAL